MQDLLKHWQEGKTEWVDPVFTYAPILMLTVDEDLTILNASQYLLDEFGYRQQDMRGQKLAGFVYDSDDSVWPQLVAPSIRNDFQVLDSAAEFRAASGNLIPVSVSASTRLEASDYGPAGLFVFNRRTVSDRKPPESDQAARNYFRSLNHELRTPMNAIMGMNDLLQVSPLNEQQYEMTRKIRSACDSMMLLINSLHDEPGKSDSENGVEVNEFNLRSFVDTVANHWLPKASLKGLAFNLDLEDGLPDRITSDADRLAQALNSLLGNALERTETGAVSLQVFPLDVQGPASHIAFDIQDTSSADRSALSDADLSACREICETLGGTLDATPVWSGEGLYTITIPTGQAPDAGSTEENSGDSTGSVGDQFDGCTVLVVEDNQLNQALLRSILDSIGIECDLADTGEEAIELCAKNSYDLIFMDIQMPGMNGVAAAKKIRSNLPQYEYCPIIAVTANALKNSREDYLREGLDGYIAKPYSPKDIRRITAQIATNAA